MGEMEWILLAAGPLFAVSGAIMLALQKRGKSNPFISAEEAGGHVVSGGGIMLIGIVFGTIQLYRISGMAAVVYLVVSLMIYILIHVIFREK